jgi:guanine deaminase
VSRPVAHRGQILHLLDDPDIHTGACKYYSDGILLVEDGHISACGPASSIQDKLPPTTQVVEHPNALIVPGFIDSHIHFPQCDIIASYGTQLIEWLNTYTFPAEGKFDSATHSDEVAKFFLDELLRNGTTTALVFGTSNTQSVESFFCEAQRRSLRMICGKVMMDRNAPEYLCDTPESSYADSQHLIDRWHGKDRLGYAVTPRFAPTSSPRQLAFAGQLLAENPGVHMHTHLAENVDECEWVQRLFPDSKNYLDVYDHHGLLGKRSVFAHGIHLTDTEWKRLSSTDSAIAFCPTSNLFIGSGLFKLALAKKHQVKVGMGTDVGGGDSLSLLRTMNEAYKTQQLLGVNIDAMQMLYLATLGGARALDLHNYIGNFELGKEADFVVLDYSATALLKRRTSLCDSIAERLFVLLMLGDDRAIRSTYSLGSCVHERR